MSIKFGVSLILFLMVVMMFATQFEASTSTRAMKHFIYASQWFDAAIYLFVLNIIVNTFRRRPFKFKHTGFLTVHVGVLVIVTGGLTTRYFGIDGTMPIPEGEASREILLPQSDIVVTAADATVRYEVEYELTPWDTDVDDLFEIPGTPLLLHVDRYFPTGAVSDTLIADGPENPLVRIAVGGQGVDAVADWLEARNPERDSVTHAGVTLHFLESAAAVELRAAWAARDAETEPGPAGHLRVFWADGRSEVLEVPRRPDAPIETSRAALAIEIVQVFRSFTLTPEGHTDAAGQPPNPAIRFRVLGSQASQEEHFAFTKFPEFRAEAPQGEEWSVHHSEWTPDEQALVNRRGARELVLVPTAPDEYRAWTRWGDVMDGVPLTVDETHSFSGTFLRILETSERGRIERTVVHASDEILRPVLSVHLVEAAQENIVRRASFVERLTGGRDVGPASAEPNHAWVFHNEGYRFETEHGPVEVRYEGRSLPLDFAIHLDDFVEEKYPGVALAASFESHVKVHPAVGDAFTERIYMNHPLVYEGFTFYQASFQRKPDGQEITVLSVARDPGMTLSFVGCCILVLGLVLIFFVKPYFRKLDDFVVRRKASAGGVA